MAFSSPLQLISANHRSCSARQQYSKALPVDVKCISEKLFNPTVHIFFRKQFSSKTVILLNKLCYCDMV